MAISPIQLPYAQNDLESYISEKTIDFHYNKHHKGYANNLNNLIEGKEYENLSLENIILTSNKNKDTAIFNNSAQVYNHNIFWLSMKKNGGGKIKDGALKSKIEDDFSSCEDFINEFKNSAVKTFGSGWSWLCYDKNQNKLIIKSTSNAATPITDGLNPLINIDVWEHSYYLDYQNKRPEYVDMFFANLVNWEYAEEIFVSLKV